MNNNLRWGFEFLGVVALCIAFFMLGKSCNEPCDGLTKTDTVVVHRVDTVWPPKDTVKVKVRPVAVAAKRADKPVPGACDSVREYVSTYSDSSVSISVRTRLLGVMTDSVSIHYLLKVPLTITVHDSTVIYKGVPDTRKCRLFGGVSLYYDKEVIRVTPTLYGVTRAGLFGAGYDVLNKGFSLHLAWQLSRR